MWGCFKVINFMQFSFASQTRLRQGLNTSRQIPCVICDFPLNYKEKLCGRCMWWKMWSHKINTTTTKQWQWSIQRWCDMSKEGFPWEKSRKITQINSNVLLIFQMTFIIIVVQSAFDFLFVSLTRSEPKGQKRWHGMIMFAINFFLSLIYLHWQTITHSPTCESQALFKQQQINLFL